MKKSIKKTPQVTLSLKSVGNDREITSDSVIHAIQSIDINPLEVRGRGMFQFQYNGKTFHKLLMPLQFRRLTANTISKLMLAKLVNMALGITVTSYE